MKTPVLLKLSGELLRLDRPFGEHISSIARQISFLMQEIPVAIVIGGGNIFRGDLHSKLFYLAPTTGHAVGMLATTMNALIVQDLLKQHGVSSTILTAFDCSIAGNTANMSRIREAFNVKHCIIFAGGIGAPFVTTDTAAIIRGLQCSVNEIWKITKVDGIYSDDPQKNPQAIYYKTISYDEAVTKNLRILDSTALNLAKENKVRIRVFSMFEENALIKAYQDPTFGSLLTYL